MAYCINCGQQIADGATFCTNCGAPQTSAHMQAPDQNPSGNTDFASGYGTSGGYNGGQGGYGTSGGYNGGQGGYGTSGGYNGGQGGYGTSGGYVGGPTPSMSFVEAVQTCLTKKYANFSGRARRSEYWYYSLFSVLVSWAVSIIGNMLFVHNEGDINILSSIASLALFLPGLGVSIRRLHDIGKSGWWYLFVFLPIIGWIVLIVLYCKDSERGPNQYGQSSKYPG